VKKYIDGVGGVLYSSESDLTNINELLVEDALKFLKNSSKSVLYYKEFMNLDNFELCCISTLLVVCGLVLYFTGCWVFCD
jgi:hypothetical protein